VKSLSDSSSRRLEVEERAPAKSCSELFACKITVGV